MPFYEFEGKKPSINSEAFIHPEAVLIGDVEIAAGCYVGAGQFCEVILAPSESERGRTYKKTALFIHFPINPQSFIPIHTSGTDVFFTDARSVPMCSWA